MSSRIILGIAGAAGDGKDTFFSILNQKIKSKRFALADRLKADLKDRIQKENGFDIFNCTGAQKNSVRPLLVSYGKEKRVTSQGKYWTTLLQRKIDEDTSNDVAVITDIRYDLFPEDELFWLKKTMGGHLIFVESWTTKDFHTKEFTKPINDDEALNNPRLRRQADYIVSWPRLNLEGEHLFKELSFYVEEFIQKYLNRFITG